jgi:hypothetical protein
LGSARLESRGVEGVFRSIPLILVHADGGLNKKSIALVVASCKHILIMWLNQRNPAVA